MDLAVVTGASSGIGLEIAKMLVEQSYVVRALARDFSSCDFAHERFVPVPCDVSDRTALEYAYKAVDADARPLRVLVNNAGMGLFGPHETLAVEKIDQMVRTNLTAPLMLTKLALRALQQSKGTIVNIASTAALYPHRFGCAYAAVKAGLLQFGESLFDEVRKSGVKVCTVCPDMTAGTNFYDNASFAPDAAPDCHIEPSCVADAVREILGRREGTVQSLVVLRPQRVGVSRK